MTSPRKTCTLVLLDIPNSVRRREIIWPSDHPERWFQKHHFWHIFTIFWCFFHVFALFFTCFLMFSEGCRCWDLCHSPPRYILSFCQGWPECQKRGKHEKSDKKMTKNVDKMTKFAHDFMSLTWFRRNLAQCRKFWGTQLVVFFKIDWFLSFLPFFKTW